MRKSTLGLFLLLMVPAAAWADHIDYVANNVFVVPGPRCPPIGNPCQPIGFDVDLGDRVKINFGYDTGGANPYFNLMADGQTYVFNSLIMSGSFFRIGPSPFVLEFIAVASDPGL